MTRTDIATTRALAAAAVIEAAGHPEPAALGRLVAQLAAAHELLDQITAAAYGADLAALDTISNALAGVLRDLHRIRLAAGGGRE
jgi:hypothetical protein